METDVHKATETPISRDVREPRVFGVLCALIVWSRWVLLNLYLQERKMGDRVGGKRLVIRRTEAHQIITDENFATTSLSIVIVIVMETGSPVLR
jgi:hypothetical protein